MRETSPRGAEDHALTSNRERRAAPTLRFAPSSFAATARRRARPFSARRQSGYRQARRLHVGRTFAMDAIWPIGVV
jgi:hypothetical protein